VKLFKKPKSKFYWYDFAVRGRRYRGSTQETKSVRALRAASLKLASSMENTDPLPSKPTVLGEFANRFASFGIPSLCDDCQIALDHRENRLLGTCGDPLRRRRAPTDHLTSEVEP
jgi:hypothetical protein